MSLFRRIKNLVAKPEPPAAPRSILTLGPGDICEVSLVTYEVTGRTNNRQRNAVVLTLQDGADIRYLVIEERETTAYALYQPIDGRLDSIEEVPAELDLDGRTFYLEEQFAGYTTSVGRTPFRQTGEQSVWQYQSDDRKLLRIEWQDGRFMLYEGDSVLPADVKVIRGS